MMKAAAPHGPKHTLPPEQTFPAHVKADKEISCFDDHCAVSCLSAVAVGTTTLAVVHRAPVMPDSVDYRGWICLVQQPARHARLDGLTLNKSD